MYGMGANVLHVEESWSLCRSSSPLNLFPCHCSHPRTVSRPHFQLCSVLFSCERRFQEFLHVSPLAVSGDSPQDCLSPPFPALHNGTDLLPLPCCRVQAGNKTNPWRTSPWKEPRGGEELHKHRPNGLETADRCCQAPDRIISHKQDPCHKGSKIPRREDLRRFFFILFLLSLTPPRRFDSGDMETSKCFIVLSLGNHSHPPSPPCSVHKAPAPLHRRFMSVLLSFRLPATSGGLFVLKHL